MTNYVNKVPFLINAKYNSFQCHSLSMLFIYPALFNAVMRPWGVIETEEFSHWLTGKQRTVIFMECEDFSTICVITR